MLLLTQTSAKHRYTFPQPTHICLTRGWSWSLVGDREGHVVEEKVSKRHIFKFQFISPCSYWLWIIPLELPEYISPQRH